MFNFVLGNLMTNFYQYRKFILFIFILLILGVSHFAAYFHGKTVANEENKEKYDAELIQKLKDQEEKNKEQIKKIKDNISTEEKIRIVYKDRIKTVKEIVKAENFKCEMTDEQIKSLNSFKKPS